MPIMPVRITLYPFTAIPQSARTSNNGVETLVYNDSGIKAVLARNINEELEKAGFKKSRCNRTPESCRFKTYENASRTD